MSHSQHLQTTTKQQQQQQQQQEQMKQEKQQTELTTQIPDPEVVPKAKRRQFSAAYKLRIVQEADACTAPGQIGSLLRREGLYSSYLSKWRRQREEGQLQALSAKKRGRKGHDPSVEELAGLQRENERLRARLEQAEIIIDVQKKLSQLLGLTTNTIESDESMS
jgi:transposase-like protein